MKLQAPGGVTVVAQVAANKVSMRCPVCGQLGTFEAIVGLNDGQLFVSDKMFITGQRLCPNRACRAVLFVVLNSATKEVVVSYPPKLIDFDTTNIPISITKAMEEAIACHSIECYIAAAIMVRKTLEELCHDRKATGDNLKQRLRDLGTTIVLPKGPVTHAKSGSSTVVTMPLALPCSSYCVLSISTRWNGMKP